MLNQYSRVYLRFAIIREVKQNFTSRGVRGLDDPYQSTHIEGFGKISVKYRYRYLEHPCILAYISASAAGPTLEIVEILQSPFCKMPWLREQLGGC